MSTTLYRKYRSKSLSEIKGQAHVTDVLSRALAQGRIAHAYLLTGPRGVGKTSIARILAHEINGLPYTADMPHLDIIEIDAASNNGVEDVRDLRDKVQIAPVSAAKKIYIIDEVHMLSKAAFNALLKTLEEPPAHVVFILATTDVEKLPATIISRTQRFHFRAISADEAINHLRWIAEQEGIAIDDDALALIAQHGDGSFRDSINLLDQISSLADTEGGVTCALVERSLGLAPHKLVEQLLNAYETANLSNITTLLQQSDQSGVQPVVLASQLIRAIRSALNSKPQLLPLLDHLLDVSKSSNPGVKLLVVLAEHAQMPKPKTVATAAAAPPTISEPVAAPKATLATPSPLAKPPVSAAPPTQPSGSRPKAHSTGPDTIDWPALLATLQEAHPAVHTLLTTCSHTYAAPVLTIYTGNAFYKKKLDDTKYRLGLAEGLATQQAGDVTIETVPTTAPPQDAQAAAVAALMGGGEEISVA